MIPSTLHGTSAECRLPREPELLPFPTAAQRDLLKAALLPAEHAAPAWRRWKARGLQLQTADAASCHIFSFLWLNRDAAAIEVEDRPLLKGVYRASLANNAVVFANALSATQILTEAGIPVLFFKGAAMIATAPDGLGVCRIPEVDVLIPEADALRAASLLIAAGYHGASGYQAYPPIGIRHAWACKGPNESVLNVHWWAFKTAGDDRVMFDTAREATLLDRSVLVPSVTEALITTIANGFGSTTGTSLFWIADSLMLLKINIDAIEWDTLVQRARRPGLALSLAGGLDFLAREFGVPVPPRVLAELRRLPVSWQERGAYWAAINGLQVRAVLLDELLRHWARRRYYPTGVPKNFLSHIAQVVGTKGGRRRDVFKRHALRFLQGIAERVIAFMSRLVKGRGG